VNLVNKPTFDRFRAAEAFPESSLHPSLQGRVWAAAVRGEFDSAVAQGFKLLEEHVRAAGGFKNASSHRTVPYGNIREAQQVLMFVSLLLNIIDTRAGGTSSP
jgi:hypothetical protein